MVHSCLYAPEPAAAHTGNRHEVDPQCAACELQNSHPLGACKCCCQATPQYLPLCATGCEQHCKVVNQHMLFRACRCLTSEQANKGRCRALPSPTAAPYRWLHSLQTLHCNSHGPHR
jgi:hypothetical protein